ncbi:MAG: DUF2784 domain-containing protein [Lentisphaeria bacterium]
MAWRCLAELVVLVHAAFVAFVVVGGLLALRWRRLAWLHLPVAAWGVLVEFTGWVCPLTPLEKWLRVRGGGEGYEGGFISHHLTSLLYPAGLTRESQWLLGALALAINLAVYALFLARGHRRRRDHPPAG